jgi:hypothetical protein
VKCTPDETGRCTTCGDILSVPKKATDADRIAALEAELAEARRDLHEERSRANDYGKAIERERAAHERTKVELAAERADRLNIDEHRGRLLTKRDAAQAEAAAMRLMLEVIHPRPAHQGMPQCRICQAIDGTAGRALAARVPLLEAVAAIALRVYDEPEDFGDWWEDLGAALAALDSQEPT